MMLGNARNILLVIKKFMMMNDIESFKKEDVFVMRTKHQLFNCKIKKKQ